MAQAQSVQLPKRWPLALEPDNRGSVTTQDARLVNAYVERDKLTGDYWLFKRACLSQYSQPSGGAAIGGGIYNWLGNIYSVFGTSLYKDNTSIGTVDGTNGVYQFSLSSGTTPRLVLGNGVKAYTYDGTTFAVISDVNFPASFYKGWCYLDKTTYLMTSPNKIRGSGLDDPTSWDPLNVINAQVRPDTGIGMSQQLVYAIAFKQWTTEVFYDQINPTGSPLGTVQGAKVNWGCASIDAVQSIDDILIWPATNRGSSVQVIALDNLKPSIISTPSIERLLDEADFSSVASFSFKDSGHWFYVLTLYNNNITLVYDLKERMWAQWTDTNGAYFPVVSMTYGATQKHLVQHKTNGKIYYLDAAYNNDDGALITVDAYTPNFDAGTKRRKQLGAIYFVGDQTAGSILQVRRSDDDYGTWSNFRNVDLSQRLPRLPNCGTFARRAYHLRHRCNTTLRLQAMDLQMDIGTL